MSLMKNWVGEVTDKGESVFRNAEKASFLSLVPSVANIGQIESV